MIARLGDRSVVPVGTTLAILASALVGCAQREPAGRLSDSSGMASMPGMTPSQLPAATGGTDIRLTSAQVRHGGVRWAPATAGGASGAATLSLATLPGQLAPNEDRTARLGAPGEGRVLAVRVSPGDRVRKGQVLVTLQSPAASMAQSDLTKAAAALGSARAQATYAASAGQRAERLLALKAIRGRTMNGRSPSTNWPGRP